VAKKRRRKRIGLKALLLFILTPLVVWFFAFLIWFHWNGITKLIRQDKEQAEAPPRAEKKPGKADSAAEKRSGEKIFEEDRRKLEDIVKKRQ
jgi:hypothetical protein